MTIYLAPAQQATLASHFLDTDHSPPALAIEPPPES
jgi:hypothetical protein